MMTMITMVVVVVAAAAALLPGLSVGQSFSSDPVACTACPSGYCCTALGRSRTPYCAQAATDTCCALMSCTANSCTQWACPSCYPMCASAPGDCMTSYAPPSLPCHAARPHRALIVPFGIALNFAASAASSPYPFAAM